MLLSDLRPQIRLLVPNAPNPLIDMMVVDACRELCRRTNVWRYELESGDLSKEGRTVVLSPPEDAVILRPYSVEYADYGPLRPATRAQLSRADAVWRDADGDPTHYVFESPATLQLYPWPATLLTTDLTVTVSLMPDLGVTELPDKIAVPYSEIIRNGALAHLLLMPGRTWANPQMGSAYGQAFSSSLDEITEEGTDSGVRNLPRNVRYGGY